MRMIIIVFFLISCRVTRFMSIFSCPFHSAVLCVLPKYVCVYVCMYMYMYLCIYVYIYDEVN